MPIARRAMLMTLLLSIPTLADAQDPKPRPEPVVTREQPPGPQTVTATVVAVGKVEITWDSVPGATTYHVGRLARPNGWQRMATVPATVRVVSDTGRNLNIPHIYSVVAILPTGSTRPTVSDTVQGMPPIVRVAPTVSPPQCGPSGPATLYCQVAQTWTGPAPVPPVEALCPAGHYIMSGGYNSALVMGHTVMSTAPVQGRQAWRVQLLRTPSVMVPPTHQHTLTVYVLCRREQ